MAAWAAEEIEFLKQQYPSHGLEFCATALQRSAASIRQKAARLGLKQDPDGPFFQDWQRRAAESKVGCKRPGQAEVMQRLREEGKLVQTEEARQRTAEGVRRWIQENGHPRGYLGKVHSPETRQKLSAASQKGWANPESKLNSEEHKQLQSDNMHKAQVAGFLRKGYSRGKQGKRADLGIYVRSAWEANYARYLNFLQAQGSIHKWAYEADTFIFEAIKRGTRSYMPDFKVWDTPESEPYYIEVKGWMDQKSRTKLNRMQKYYPNVTIRLVSGKDYKALDKQFRDVIEGWE